ncbi:MAG: RNA polymerase sigma factor RpoD, partial [Burkholderiaceae bacterium]|nr:RNA polymerase sigma factor RpoD [Burkholderiaceae bacterium]
MKKPVTKAAPKKLAKPNTKAKAAIKKAKPAAAVKKAVKVAAKKPTKAPVKKVSKSSKAPAKKAVSKVVKPIAKNAKANAKSVKPAPKLTAKKLAKKAAEEKALKKAQEKAAKEQAKAEAKAAKLKAKEAAVELDENGQPIKKTRGRKPKAEVVTEPGVDNRTDRQKARDRKAKEKALLKEFAAQQLGSEEQQELRRSRLKTLIKMGKSKGYLTHGEMNDVMSDELSEVDAMETLIGLLNDIGITVYEQAPDAETLLLNEHGPTAASEEEAEE